jgi:hypothetical protein
VHQRRVLSPCDGAAGAVGKQFGIAHREERNEWLDRQAGDAEIHDVAPGD